MSRADRWQVPFEQARRVFRHSQRLIEQKLIPLTKATAELDAQSAAAAIVELIRNVRFGAAAVFDSGKLCQEDRIESLLYRNRCEKRLKFYDQLGGDSPHGEAARQQWDQVRADRLINEYLLSKGCFASAKAIADHNDLSGLEFGDEELFAQLAAVEDRLRSRSTTEGLLWCFENRAHLKKTQSPLEFYLRRQTFVELARKRELTQAIAYGKKFFIPWMEQYRREVEQSTALLAIWPTTEVAPYKALYAETKWEELATLFRQEFLDLHSITHKPQLISNLQAGLSALKTPHCGKEADSNINCPVCVPPYAEIAKGIPNSHHENSTIVCRISGCVLNENNPPMILPNGYVYGQAALIAMSQKDGGRVTCPRTHEEFKYSDCKKVFIL